MKYLSIDEVLLIHRKIIEQSGGMPGLLNEGALESAIAQPQMTFDGIDLYLTISEKASALGYSLINNHPFQDGNKRIGHAAMEIFLILNGYEINPLASVDEQEQIILKVAASEMKREEFTSWLKQNIVELK
ncbi:MAG: type II toxin-antitoxin system death-on-curing family toxin [Blastocatellia bacterium]